MKNLAGFVSYLAYFFPETPQVSRGSPNNFRRDMIAGPHGSSQSWVFLKSCFLFFFVDDPECQYIQDSDNKNAYDHRGQMMQFCGHDPICRKFNNAEALQL